jgi:hypothetical protein
MQNVPNIVRERLKAAPLSVDHPDANVLTAFAERSLPDRERSWVLDHLARCNDCRDIVALALPATEPLPAPVTPSPRAWLTWPTLRWGFVAAGILTLASFGVLQYQRRLQPATMASATKQSTPVEAATNDGTKSVAQFSTVPTDQKEKLQAPSTPALADTLDANGTANENAEKKAIVREEPNRTRGAMIGAPLPHGPRLANQYQQQNNAQNQLPAPAAPSSFDRLQSFHENASAAVATPSTAPTPSAVPTFEASSAASAVARAKPAMPLPSRADTATNNPHGPDQDARLLRSQIAPGQIGGYVVDPSGAAVANARVTITPTPSKGETATAVTNSQGAWLIAGLPTGNYKAEAQAPGFNTTVLDLNYDANRPSLHSLTLSPGTVSETVEVSAQAEQVQATTSSTTGRAGIGGRNLSQLASVSEAPQPRWNINATGALQRSLDQGSTWQTVDVAAGPASVTSTTSVEIVAKSSRSKEKDAAKARKQDTASLVFRAVAANGSDVWAGGSSGALYHSADAGNTWTRVFPSSSGATLTGDIISLEFSEPQHGKLSTSTSEVWSTSDGGQSWQKQ